MKSAKNIFKNFGFLSIGLCALCCALPLIGVVAGMGSLALLAKYFELAAMGGLVLALAFFGIYLFRKKTAPACDVNCDCKTEAKAIERSAN
jgi:hypothetical protein